MIPAWLRDVPTLDLVFGAVILHIGLFMLAVSITAATVERQVVGSVLGSLVAIATIAVWRMQAAEIRLYRLREGVEE